VVETPVNLVNAGKAWAKILLPF